MPEWHAAHWRAGEFDPQEYHDLSPELAASLVLSLLIDGWGHNLQITPRPAIVLRECDDDLMCETWVVELRP